MSIFMIVLYCIGSIRKVSYKMATSFWKVNVEYNISILIKYLYMVVVGIFPDKYKFKGISLIYPYLPALELMVTDPGLWFLWFCC